MAQPPTTTLRGSFHPVSPLEALGKLTPMRLEELEDSSSAETVRRTPQVQPSLPHGLARFPTTTTLPPAFHTIFETPPSPLEPRGNPPISTLHRSEQQLPDLGRVPPLVLADRDASKETTRLSREPWQAVESQLVRLRFAHARWVVDRNGNLLLTGFTFFFFKISWSNLWSTTEIAASLGILRSGQQRQLFIPTLLRERTSLTSRPFVLQRILSLSPLGRPERSLQIFNA